MGCYSTTKRNEVLTCYNVDEPQKLSEVKEVRHKRVYILCFHLYNIYRMDKSIETESRLVVARDQRESDCLMDIDSGMMKKLWNQ